MDIFNKIREDTIILLHEYFTRPSYFILEKYIIIMCIIGDHYMLLLKKKILKAFH